jgi:calcineurin-like phosphoesterase family protein/Big-like domain-containing protein
MCRCCRVAVFFAGSLVFLLSGSAAFAALPVVRISSSSPIAAESGSSNALVTISRTGSTTAALTVEYTITGSAVAGRDFFRLPGRATIPASAQSVTFPVQAIDDGEEETAENVQLALASNLRPFTLMILPDTQYYTDQYGNNLDMFASQIRWLLEQKDASNVVFVLHEGDCTQNNTFTDWVNFRRYMRLLDGVVPYAMAVGNHDGLDRPVEDTALFNQFFPVSAYQNLPTFGGVFEAGKMDNCYHLFSAGGVDWLVLIIEFGPRDVVLDWANQVVANYPQRRVILVTHTHIYSDDTLHGSSATHFWTPTSYGRTNNAPEVWDKFLKKHANISFVFNGHVLNDGTGRLVGVGDHGNKVYQMLANYQMLPNGGNGLLRVVQFFPEQDKFTVRTYSPPLRRYFTTDDQQFEYENLGLFSTSDLAYTIDAAQSSVTLSIADDDHDTVPPVVVMAEALSIPAEIRLSMSEPVDPVTAGELDNYQMSHSIDLISVQVSADGQTITLRPVVQLSTGITYTVTLGNIKDRALSPNTMPATQVDFVWSPIFLVEPFDQEQMRDWVIVDEGTVDAPSSWNVRLGRLEQSANIFGPNQQTINGRKGTFAWWSKASAMTWSNYNCSVILHSTDDDGIGLLFRFRDPANYYKLELDRQQSFRRLTKVVGGAESVLATQTGGYPQDQDLYLVVECKGPEIKTSLDGEPLFGGPIMDNSFAAGTVGLYCWGNEGATFDNLWVVPDGESLGPPPSSTNTTRTTTIETVQPLDGWWRYWYATTAPGAGWRQSTFDDSNWIGPARAVFSFGAAGLAVPSNTILPSGPPTYYFRNRFNFAANTNGVTLRLRHWIDDGVVFHLNGAEIFRSGMPAGTVTHTTLANRNVGMAALEGPLDIPINNLIKGENVLAVEVHQVTLPNPDLVFGVEVEAVIPVSEPATFTSTRLLSNGRLQVVLAGQPGRSYLLQSSSNLVHWNDFFTRSNLPNTSVTILLDVTNAQQFFRAVTLP